MSTISIISFSFFIFTFITLISHLTFALQTPNFDSNISLSGDAELINGSINLIRPINSSKHGAILSKKHFKFIQSGPLSVSTDFTFLINGNGNNLCFEIKKMSRTGKDVRIRFRGNVVGVEYGGGVGKFATFGEFFDGGEKFRCWVDYEASSKQIEVRVGKDGRGRSDDPVVMYSVDLAEMWDDEVVFGLSSFGSGNVGESVSVYSWGFKVRGVPKWLHSRPMNPESVIKGEFEEKKDEKKRSCHLGVVTFGCAVLVAVVLLSFWEMFVGRYDFVTPAENNVNPVDFQYQKIGVAVENVFEDVKKEKFVV